MYAYREKLKDKLPVNIKIGTGFIIDNKEIDDNLSKKIDIIIFKVNSPLLFQEGDLVIVDSKNILRVIEVKSKLNTRVLKSNIKNPSKVSQTGYSHLRAMLICLMYH